MTAKHVLLVLAMTLALTAGARAESPTEMSVQVRNAQLRATPSYLGKPTGAAAYAERVTILQTQGDWFQVQSGSSIGWLHKSALSTKKIVMKAGAADVEATASGEELALAGKGFNSDVESDFKQKNANIDFGIIDQMEQLKVTPNEARDFLVEGGVKPVTAGGAK